MLGFLGHFIINALVETQVYLKISYYQPNCHFPRHSDIKSILDLKIYFSVLCITSDSLRAAPAVLSMGYRVKLFPVALTSQYIFL